MPPELHSRRASGKKDFELTIGTAALAYVTVGFITVFFFLPTLLTGVTMGYEGRARLANRLNAEMAQTASAAATQQMLGTQAAQEAPPPDAHPVFIDPFDKNMAGWLVSERRGKTAPYTTGKLINGVYLTTAALTSPSTIAWWLPAESDMLPENFHLSVDARQVAGEPDTAYGLVYNLPRSGGTSVRFIVAENGYFNVTWVDDRSAHTSYWKRTSMILRGTWNHLSVRREDGHTRFYINRALVYETGEIPPPEGFSGVTIEVASPAEQVFQFDNFSIYALDRRTAAP